MTETAVYAAGGVVWHVFDGTLKILAVSRVAYHDLSLPKGKVDPGEMLATTAVREVFEETGVRAHLGVPVGVSHYRMARGRQKIVHYWAMHASDRAVAASAARFRPNKEIAAIRWLTPKKALTRLTYPADIEILRDFLALHDAEALNTFPLVVLRHAKATGRDGWKGADAARPLTARGTAQASEIVAPLRAFGVRRIVSSDAVRCMTTVAPLSAAIGRKIRPTPLISQDAWESGRADPDAVLVRRLRAGKPAVVCSHRPVLPDVLSSLARLTGTAPGSYLNDAAALEVAAFSVAHIRRAAPEAGIVTIETHTPKG